MIVVFIFLFLGMIVPIALFTWWMKRTTGYDVRGVEDQLIGRFLGDRYWRWLNERAPGDAEKSRPDSIPQHDQIDLSRLRDGTDVVDGEVVYYEIRDEFSDKTGT